jgi:hypothetical protein
VIARTLAHRVLMRTNEREVFEAVRFQKKWCRRVGFMDKVLATFPDRELHVVLDNLNTHKKNECWLKKHPRVHFHFTPKGELRGSTRSRHGCPSFRANRSATLLSPPSPNYRSISMPFISAWNEKAEPFIWSKKKVRQRRFKGTRSTQL